MCDVLVLFVFGVWMLPACGVLVFFACGGMNCLLRLVRTEGCVSCDGMMGDVVGSSLGDVGDSLGDDAGVLSADVGVVTDAGASVGVSGVGMPSSTCKRMLSSAALCVLFRCALCGVVECARLVVGGATVFLGELGRDWHL